MAGNKSFFFIICALFAVAAGYGEAVSFKINAPNKADFAQPIIIEYIADYPDRLTVKADTANVDGSLFEITDIKYSPSEDKPAETGAARLSAKLKVFPFMDGDLTFPALDWRLTDEQGKNYTAKSPPVKIKVSPPKGAPQGDEIFDIRPIYRQQNILIWILALVAALILSAIIYALKKRKTFKEEPPKIILSPDKEAFKNIDELSASGIWEKGQYKTFYIKLADICRNYVSRLYGINASLMTSYELTRELKSRGLNSEIVNTAKSFFTPCDIIKFAKQTPQDNWKERDISAVENFIKLTFTPKDGINKNDELSI